MDKDTAPPHRPSEPLADERLDSGKEIAAYMNREVRTVQRWEESEGLPVHRHQHDKLASVYAHKSELDAWRLQRCPPPNRQDAEEHTAAGREPEPQAPRPEAQQPSDPVVLPRRIPRASLLVIALAALAAVLVMIVGYFLRPPPPPTHKIKLVVLPFKNMSGDPQQAYFSEGLTEEMTTQLGSLDPARLGVIASTSANLYKDTTKSVEEIGSDLGVDYILEGSVRRDANRVRISAQLIQTSDQTHAWAQTYDRDMRDILALQSDVAQAIAEQIQLTLTPEERARLTRAAPVNPDTYEAYLQGLSYQAYLKGLTYWNERSPEALQKSIQYFNQAIRDDPKYALAYAGLANTYVLLGEVPNDVLPPRAAMLEAKNAATKALQFDDSLAEAHASLGQILQSYDWDWAGAEREYKRALEINPGYATARQWYSLLLRAMGRHQEALEQIQRAQELDPRSLVLRSTFAQAYYFARQYDRVVDLCQSTLQIDPNFLLLRYHLGRAYVEQGRLAEAIVEFEKAKKLSAGHPIMLMALGNAYGVSGRRAEALQTLQDLNGLARKRYVPALYFAAVYTGLGDKNQAFHWLNEAYRERTDYLIYLNVEPMADPLRSDARFQELLQRIGLPHKAAESSAAVSP